VQTYDAAGNTSAVTSGDAATNDTADDEAPAAASGLTAVSTEMTSAVVGWSPATDNVGVTGYDVYLLTGGTHLVGTTSGTTEPVRGLSAGRTYTVGVVAHDDADNRSAMATFRVTTAPDTVAPARPATPRVGGRAHKSLTVTWKADRDNVGVTRYYVYRWTGSTWKQIGKVKGGAHSLRDRKLRRHLRYWYRLRAQDAHGNMSAWSNMGSGATT
jgi:chitinase